MDWLGVVAVVLVALIAVACLAIKRNSAISQSDTIPSYSPAAVNDKVVIVKDWKEEELGYPMR